MNAITPIEPEVPIYDVAPRSRVTIGDAEYVYEGRHREGHVIARVDDLAFRETLTHAHLHALVRSDGIRIDEGFFTSVKAQLRLAGMRRTFSDLTKAQARKVLFKQDWCDRFLRLEHSDRRVRRSDAKMQWSIDRIAADIAAERKAVDDRVLRETGRRKKRGAAIVAAPTCPGPVQLRRWVRRYEKLGYERDALIDRYRGPGKFGTTLDADAYVLHAEYAMKYASSTRPTKAALFLQLEDALNEADAARLVDGKPPLRRLKRRAFEMMIDKLDPFFVTLGREGEEAALRRWGIVTTGVDVEKPFERLELDEWNVSLMRILVDAGVWELLDEETRKVVERKRLWLSAAIDVRTRMIVALRFLEGAPCTESALSTLELAMTDKARVVDRLGTSPTYLHAKPRSVAMDNGTHLVSDEVVRRMVMLNVDPIFPPAGLSRMRAHIERVFGTLKTRIASYFTGQTFSNIVEKGDYDAGANASLDVEELNRSFLVGVLDLYHNHPHEGLNGETPYDCMRRLSREYGLPLPPNRDVMRHVMGVSCERRIGDEGIRFLGIRYQSKALQVLRRDMRQRPVEIRVDRFDLSSVSVRTPKGGWIVCDARHDGLKDVSLWEWTEAVRDLRERNADVAALSRGHVLGAVRRLSETAEAAVRRAEIRHPVVTAATFQKLERTLFLGLSFADDGRWGEDVVLPAQVGSSDATVAAPTAGTHGAAVSATPIEAEDVHGFGSPDEWNSD